MNIKVKLTLESNAKYHDVPVGTIVDINIEEYLKAVVASEIANSHIEACKAQAVAARTFALIRMRSRGYLYDNTIDQAYISSRGFNLLAYPNAIKAVDDTAGQVLTYDGKLLRECLYGASNGGETKAYQSLPYLISQPDPWDAAETAQRRANGNAVKVGNKYGLSQYGARWAAEHGVGYQDILAFYYIGAKIAHSYGKEEDMSQEITKRTLNPKEQAIADWARKQVGSGYVWGSVGQTLTENALTALIVRHGANIPMPLVRKWIGKKVFDCAGLVTAALSNHLRLRVVSGASSQWKGAYWALKGTINTMPKDYVVCLYKEKPTANPMQHTGLYLGDGNVTDARGSSSGVIYSKFESYPWSHWAIPKGLLSDADIAAIKSTVPNTAQNPGQTTPAKPVTTGGGTMANFVATAITNGSQLALRKGMSTVTDIITRMDAGSFIGVVEKTNDTWWKVQVGTQVGYVMMKYLTVTNIAPVNPNAKDDGEGGQDEVEDNQHVIHLLCKDEAEAIAVLKLLKTAVKG